MEYPAGGHPVGHLERYSSMDFFGIGPFEILLVLIIAFVVLGPQRLLDMSKKAGKVMGDLKKSASDLNDQVNKEIRETTSMVVADKKPGNEDIDKPLT